MQNVNSSLTRQRSAPTRVLVLGNDPQINTIDFERLAPDVITLGVNRIWLKHIPHYFFFNDTEILRELEKNPEVTAKLMQRSITYSSDWLTNGARKDGIKIPNWIKIHPRNYGKPFPDSVTTAINLHARHYRNRTVANYYVAGVSLVWREPSHFWKSENYPALNRHGKDWYEPRFLKVFDNFQSLRNTRIPIISVNPESMLNKLFRYESIENLYRK